MDLTEAEDIKKRWQEHPGKKKERKKERKSLSRVRLCDPMDCSLPGSSDHGIFQARVLEWVAISFSNTKKIFMIQIITMM